MLSPSLGLARRAANGQATRRASLHVKFRPPARRPNRQTNRWCRPFRLAVSPGGRRSQLSCESEFFVRCYVFVRCLTRPPNHLGMPLASTPQSRIRFAPMKEWLVPAPLYPDVARAQAGSAPNRHRYGLRGVLRSRSEEAPTLMALGGFEQMSLNPHPLTACCLTVCRVRLALPKTSGGWPAMDREFCAPRAAWAMANPRTSSA